MSGSQPWPGLGAFANLGQLAPLAGWAREALDTLIAPHSAHGDPAEHPECPLCRGIAIVQAAIGESGTRPPEPEITWVPVTRTRA